MLSVISALHHVPLFMDRIWLLLMAVETEVVLQLLQTRCVVIWKLTGQDECIKFDGSSANVTYFSI